MSPFFGLVLPLDDDVNEVKEMRSFFRLSFSQRSLFDEIIPKEIFPSYYNERCARVCSRRTQSDRDLLLLFRRARFTPRDRK